MANNRLFQCFLLIFFVCIASVLSRGRRINIYGGEHGNDIVQLRVKRSNRSLASSLSSRRKTFRNALLPNSPLKWSKMKDNEGNFLIPYVITGIYDNAEKKIIENSINRIAENSCIKFIPRTNQRDYAEIRNQKGEGCYASIGRFRGRNIVMLESNEEQSCIQEDTVIHELFHVIGLWHEHMRFDRDNFIKVLYSNIEPDQYAQFEKLSPREATTYNVPYDYQSVMHYDENAFAKPGMISMVAINPSYQKLIGHPADASPGDYKKICAIYGCKKCMNQDFNEIVKSSNIDLNIPMVTIPTIYVQPACKDQLTICSILKLRNVLNCDLMLKYCCSSCSSNNVIATTTSQPITTSASAKNGFFEQIFSWFS